MKRKALKPGRQPRKARSRLPEDALSFPLGHPIRLEGLTRLHEGEASPGDVAEQIDENVKIVANHLRDLYEAGCIEFAGYRGRGALRKKIYRAIAPPYVSDEEFMALPLDERHDLIGTVLQWSLAECLGSYRKGRMDDDEDLCIMVDEPRVDAMGKKEVHDLLERTWAGKADDPSGTLDSVKEIEGRAANRLAESGEDGTRLVVMLFAFERGHSKAPPKSELPSEDK